MGFPFSCGVGQLIEVAVFVDYYANGKTKHQKFMIFALFYLHLPFLSFCSRLPLGGFGGFVDVLPDISPNREADVLSPFESLSA